MMASRQTRPIHGVIGASAVHLGDTLTVTTTVKPRRGPTVERRSVFEGVVDRIGRDNTTARLAKDGDYKWVGLVPNDIDDVIIERTARSYEVGETYRVHHPGDHRSIVRIWTREKEGWRSTSGFISDGLMRDNSFEIGEQVNIEPV